VPVVMNFLQEKRLISDKLRTMMYSKT